MGCYPRIFIALANDNNYRIKLMAICVSSRFVNVSVAVHLHHAPSNKIAAPFPPRGGPDISLRGTPQKENM